MTALQFLQVLARSGKKASELAGVCASYPQILINVEVPHSGGVKEQIMASQELAEAVRQQGDALNGEQKQMLTEQYGFDYEHILNFNAHNHSAPHWGDNPAPRGKKPDGPGTSWPMRRPCASTGRRTPF